MQFAKTVLAVGIDAVAVITLLATIPPALCLIACKKAVLQHQHWQQQCTAAADLIELPKPYAPLSVQRELGKIYKHLHSFPALQTYIRIEPL